MSRGKLQKLLYAMAKDIPQCQAQAQPTLVNQHCQVDRKNAKNTFPQLPSNIQVFVQSTHRDVVGGFELEEPADVEREGEEDKAEDGHDAGVLAGL